MTIRSTRPTVVALGATLVAAGIVAAVVVAAGSGSGPAARTGTRTPAATAPPVPGPAPAGSVRAALTGLKPATTPPGWRRVSLPNGTAVLSFPPTMHQIPGDKGTVSAAEFSPSGAFRLFLNATPRQGTESLSNWSGYRLHILRGDTAARARLDAAATGLRFRGGTGSCVIDDYVTRVKSHHYVELACLVQGRSGASVIVAAAPAARWHAAQPVLDQAVAAYLVR